MKKNIKRMAAIVLAMCTLGGTMGMMSACEGPGGGGGGGGNNPTVIQIMYRRAGLGLSWVETLVEKFEAKYPEYDVDFDYVSEHSYLNTVFGKGAEYDETDLFMFPQNYLPTDILLEYAEPLDDILAKTLEGETKSIGKKMLPGVANAVSQADGHVYGIPYGGGALSIAYDKNIIDGVNYSIPNTTDELEELVIALGEDDSTPAPFIHFKGGGYWPQMAINWFVQYDGLDYYHNRYQALTDEEGNSPYMEMMTATDDGRYEALKVMEKILTPDTVHESSNGDGFTEQQTKFLNGQAVMMVNGAWLMNEMSADASKQHYGLMKVPVISSLAARCQSIENDVELSALITAIDRYTNAKDVPLTGNGYDVSETDRDRIYEARNVCFTTTSDETFIIPTYAAAKDGAKKFIEFYCSDEGLATFTNTTKMAAPLSFDKGEIDTTGWTDWQLDQLEMSKTLIPIYTSNTRSPIFSIAGAAMFWQQEPVNSFTTKYENARSTAEKLWTSIKNGHKFEWKDYLKDANLA